MHQRRLERHGNVEATLTPNNRPRGQQEFSIIDDKSASIPLTHGYETIVDLQEIPKLIKHTWHLHRDSSNRVSARAKINGRLIYLHNFLIGEAHGLVIDHINRDPLDNRKENLRHVTSSENALNSSRSDNAVGMTFNKLEKKWKAYIRTSNGRKHLGTFRYREQAEEAIRIAKESR